MDGSVTEAFCCDGRTVALPIELLSLSGLEDVLSLDTWRALTKADRDRLTKLLPPCEDENQEEAAVQFALNDSTGLAQGTPASRCLEKMRSGLLHPAMADHRKRSRELAGLQHTLDVRDYHNKMVYRLLKYKDSIRFSAEDSDGDWSDEEHTDPQAAPAIPPRHPWALPVLEAVHRILQDSPNKQAKFEHLVQICAASLTPSRGVPEINSEPEPPMRHLLRACLFFMSQRPAGHPLVRLAPGCQAEWCWNAAEPLTRPELIRLSVQFSRKLSSVKFITQVKCDKNLGFTGEGNNTAPRRVAAPAAAPAINMVSNDEAVREFHKQEHQRFSNPYKPFRYMDLVSGKTTVVAPLRKASHGSTKGRDHNVLVADRPPHVTVLALVRDAAARLPNGQGTRQDICDLLRSSQYILEDVADLQLSQVATNALDRLLAQHMDPCLEYDDHRKKYVYKHLNRTESDFINKRGAKARAVSKAGHSPSMMSGGAPTSDISEFDEESDESDQEKK